jgi:hypothetical protein
MPVEWCLLTNRLLNGIDKVVDLINCYRARCRIEMYFVALKNGCKVEALRLRAVPRLEIALARIVAQRINLLMRPGRHQRHALGLWRALICVLAIVALVAPLYWRSVWPAYDAYAPDTHLPAARPALIVLYGRSGDGATLRQWLGFDDFAQQYSFIVIHPQSHQDGWDFGVGIRERGMVARRCIDHTRLILEILNEVDESHAVDRRQVFAAGMSDGTSMAVHMSCESPGVLAG